MKKAVRISVAGGSLAKTNPTLDQSRAALPLVV